MSKQSKWVIGASVVAALSVFWLGQTIAQTAPAGQGAAARVAQEQANEKLAYDYYKPGNTIDQRLSYISPSFVNHSMEMIRFMELNPQIKSSKEGFRVMVDTRAKLINDPNTGSNGPNSKPWKVIASGDLVTVVHERQLPNPSKPGQTYTFYAFDLFRVQDGKFVEHWDGAQVPQPLPTLLATPINQIHFPNQAK